MGSFDLGGAATGGISGFIGSGGNPYAAAAGAAIGGFGGSNLTGGTRGGLQTRTFEPSAEIKGIAGQLKDFDTSGITGFGPLGGLGPLGEFGQLGEFDNSNQFLNLLGSELDNPNFGPQGTNEQALIDQLISQTQGATAVRGLGPATTGGVARSIAPTLVGLRQNRLSNLLSAGGLSQQQTGLGLQARGQGIQRELGIGQLQLGGRGQDLQRLLGERELNLRGELGAADLSLRGLSASAQALQPTIVGGISETTSPGLLSTLLQGSQLAGNLGDIFGGFGGEDSNFLRNLNFSDA